MCIKVVTRSSSLQPSLFGGISGEYGEPKLMGLLYESGGNSNLHGVQGYRVSRRMDYNNPMVDMVNPSALESVESIERKGNKLRSP